MLVVKLVKTKWMHVLQEKVACGFKVSKKRDLALVLHLQQELPSWREMDARLVITTWMPALPDLDAFGIKALEQKAFAPLVSRKLLLLLKRTMVANSSTTRKTNALSTKSAPGLKVKELTVLAFQPKLLLNKSLATKKIRMLVRASKAAHGTISAMNMGNVLSLILTVIALFLLIRPLLLLLKRKIFANISTTIKTNALSIKV